MHRPATLTDAVEVVRKSRLVSEDRLSVYLDGLRADWPLDPAPVEFFDGMVRHGLLTAFQATQLGIGRWKGFEIGNYRVLDRLGQGGMGQVFLAEHLTLGRRVALKLLLSRQTSSPLAMERFVREARTAAKLDHPNIIRVHDINVAHHPPYIVMEFADGVTLQASVSRKGPFDPGEAAGVILQVARGLEEASRHGLVHRDVKPANVIIDRQGVARLLDLGIVRIEGENLTGEYAKTVILGTIDYLAPEQSIDSSDVDTRADIYSLGATLYFLLTGTTPVPAGTLKDRLKYLQTVDPPDLRILRPDASAGLAAVLRTMMAKRADERYQSPSAVVEALTPHAVQFSSQSLSLRQQKGSTLSDTSGTQTPPGGTRLPATEITEMPEPSVEFYKLPGSTDLDGVSLELQRALNEMQPPRVSTRSQVKQSLLPTVDSTNQSLVWGIVWAVAGFAVIFGLVGIAFYIWK